MNKQQPTKNIVHLSHSANSGHTDPPSLVQFAYTESTEI